MKKLATQGLALLLMTPLFIIMFIGWIYAAVINIPICLFLWRNYIEQCGHSWDMIFSLGD